LSFAFSFTFAIAYALSFLFLCVSIKEQTRKRHDDLVKKLEEGERRKEVLGPKLFIPTN
jgi:hypothetical protein